MIPEWLPLFITNYTTIMGDFWNWATQGYNITLGVLFYPMFLGGVIGYVYTKQQSVVAAAVAILVIVTAFVGLFAGNDAVVMFLHLLVAFIISGLLLLFLIRVRGR